MSYILHETRDYNVFKTYSGNRNINPRKVRALLKSFRERHYPVPIIVDQEMRVLDGQHRLEASRVGLFPVTFLKLAADVVPTQVIRQLNADQHAYNLTDHLKLFADDGREHYVQFKGLYERYDKVLEEAGIPRRHGPYRIIFSSMLGLLCGRDGVEGKALLRHAPKPWDQGNTSGTLALTALFREGDMEMNPAKGIATLDYLARLLEVLPRQRANGAWTRKEYSHLGTREYLCSLHYLLHYRNEHVENENELFDPEVFLEQAKYYPKKCLRQDVQPKKWTDALGRIEEIYNHGRGKRPHTYLVSV